MLTHLAFELPAFFLGLLFGSFLNVCISRLPAGASIANPRSHCSKCLNRIDWCDNVPILSYFILRGRCRFCDVTISPRYPLVELAVGLWFARIASDFANLWLIYQNSTAYWAAENSTLLLHTASVILVLPFVGFFLIGLAVTDWETHTLPNTLTYSGIALGILLACVQAAFLAPGQGDIHLNPRHNLRMSSPGSMAAQGNVFLTGPEHLVFGRIAAILVAALFPFLISYLYKLIRHRDGIGLGDVKLVAMIAAFLGFWPAMLSLFFGVILCAIYAIILLARKRATGLTRLPLGTFLCIGGLVAALTSDIILPWYRSLL